MTWLFSKAMMEHCESLRFSQEREAEFSEENYSDGKQYAQLSVMPTPHKFWRNDKTMEFCDLSRFGLTLQLLTEIHGEELLTLYLEGFRVRTLAAPEEVQGLTESDPDCGESLRGLLARYDPYTHSLKTAQCSLFADLIESSVTLHRWGILRNGELYPHPISELPIIESAYGLWPTPTANEFRTHNRDVLIARRERAKESKKNGNGFGLSLGNALTIAGDNGDMNPEWVEWLMGWPIGWTDLKPLAMDKFQLWHQQHSIYLDSKTQ